jgi:hypothetical protein
MISKGLISVMSVTVVGLAMPTLAHAFCNGFDPSSETLCYAPWEDRYQGVTAVVGRDPSDNRHWIGWQNNVTGECAWDSIGDAGTGELGGWDGDRGGSFHVSAIRILGSFSNDMLRVAGFPESFCGFTQTAVSFNNPDDNVIHFEGDEGVDVIYVLSNGANAQLLGGEGNDYILSARADVYAYGGPGDDNIAIYGDERGGLYAGGDDNDTISYYPYNGTARPIMSCGDGSDSWCGPGGRPADCETTLPADSKLLGSQRCP